MLVDRILTVASDGETRGSAATHAAKRTIEARAGHKSVISDRDLTVTQANVRKHRETLDLKISLN
jgi:hypothetical protein